MLKVILGKEEALKIGIFIYLHLSLHFIIFIKPQGEGWIPSCLNVIAREYSSPQETYRNGGRLGLKHDAIELEIVGFDATCPYTNPNEKRT